MHKPPVGKRLGVIGDGRLALAISHLAAKGGVTVWHYAPDPERLEQMMTSRALPDVIPEIEALDDRVRVVESVAALARETRVIFFTIVMGDVRELLRAIGDELAGWHQILHAAHRLHGPELTTTGELIRQCTPCLQVGALAGPLHVGEMMTGMPNAAKVGSPFPELIRHVDELLPIPQLRIYGHDDLLGVELAASLVQMVAVLVGLVDALDLGAAVHATLMSRGLAEVAKLGTHLGARVDTFYGLSGVAKLVDHARRGGSNYDLGKRLADPFDTEDMLAHLPAESQGLALVGPVRRYAVAHEIHMPVVTALARISQKEADPREAITEIL